VGATKRAIIEEKLSSRMTDPKRKRTCDRPVCPNFSSGFGEGAGRCHRPRSLCLLLIIIIVRTKGAFPGGLHCVGVCVCGVTLRHPSATHCTVVLGLSNVQRRHGPIYPRKGRCMEGSGLRCGGWCVLRKKRQPPCPCSIQSPKNGHLSL
jgi:hypothetical protein